jgi:hypothetical protein
MDVLLGSGSVIAKGINLKGTKYHKGFSFRWLPSVPSCSSVVDAFRGSFVKLTHYVYFTC